MVLHISAHATDPCALWCCSAQELAELFSLYNLYDMLVGADMDYSTTVLFICNGFFFESPVFHVRVGTVEGRLSIYDMRGLQDEVSSQQ